MIDYLERQNISISSISLRKFDFSTAEVSLITSVPGYHNGRNLYSYGHMKVRNLLSKLPKSIAHQTIICQVCNNK